MVDLYVQAGDAVAAEAARAALKALPRPEALRPAKDKMALHQCILDRRKAHDASTTKNEENKRVVMTRIEEAKKERQKQVKAMEDRHRHETAALTSQWQDLEARYANEVKEIEKDMKETDEKTKEILIKLQEAVDRAEEADGGGSNPNQVGKKHNVLQIQLASEVQPNQPALLRSDQWCNAELDQVLINAGLSHEAATVAAKASADYANHKAERPSQQTGIPPHPTALPQPMPHQAPFSDQIDLQQQQHVSTPAIVAQHSQHLAAATVGAAAAQLQSIHQQQQTSLMQPSLPMHSEVPTHYQEQAAAEQQALHQANVQRMQADAAAAAQASISVAHQLQNQAAMRQQQELIAGMQDPMEAQLVWQQNQLQQQQLHQQQQAQHLQHQQQLQQQAGIAERAANYLSAVQGPTHQV